ncbi:MAG: TetR/AcrR family transcriptional regulator [Bacteroidetes bacterium]|nr:TetR/AcrR family transcriptional regulator [Bacteroidota bacterium]
MSTSSNPKRLQILATGKELFWKFGFKRVTIEEISKEAGVSKMTFYKFFPNKIELAKIILDEVFEDSLNKIHKLHDEHESPDKTLKKIIQLKAEGSKNVSEEFIKDLYANPEGELKEYIEGKSQMMFAEMIQVYKKGKEDGWVRKDLNIPFFILYIQKSLDMLSSDEMLHFFDTSQEMIMEITNLFVYGISPHK